MDDNSSEAERAEPSDEQLQEVTGTRVLLITCDADTGALEMDAAAFQPWEVAGIALWLTKAAEDDLESEEDD